MDFAFVGIGGVLGALARFQLGKIVSRRSETTFPIGTFLINITGALLLGILTGIGAPKNIYLLLGDGFLGAYTTFSTFMYEGFNLFEEKEKINAFLYVLGSLVLGLIGYAIGFEIGKLVRLI